MKRRRMGRGRVGHAREAPSVFFGFSWEFQEDSQFSLDKENTFPAR
jgi:hypothetical protein